jgi:hypothetical protein
MAIMDRILLYFTESNAIIARIVHTASLGGCSRNRALVPLACVREGNHLEKCGRYPPANVPLACVREGNLR